MAYQGEVRRGAPALQRLCARRRGPGPAGASSARNAPSIEGRVSAMRLSGQRRLRQARRPSSVAGSGVARRRFRLVRPVVRRACCAPCACLAWRLERSSGRASAHAGCRLTRLGATASARWWLTREASVERSFKSASLCRVENLYYHSLITILTDTGRRPLSHGNCPWHPHGDPRHIVELRVRRAHKAPATLEARSNSSAPKRGMIPAVRARSVGLIGGSLAGPRPSSNTTCRCPSAHIGEDCAVEPSKEGGHRAGDELGVDVVLRGG
jgi:hypothetical protein